MFSADDPALNQSSAFKDYQVLGNGVERNREGAGEFRDRGRLLRDRFENGPPDGIGNGREDAVKGYLGMLNHMVEHYRAGLLLSTEIVEDSDLILQRRSLRWQETRQFFRVLRCSSPKPYALARRRKSYFSDNQTLMVQAAESRQGLETRWPHD